VCDDCSRSFVRLPQHQGKVRVCDGCAKRVREGNAADVEEELAAKDAVLSKLRAMLAEKAGEHEGFKRVLRELEEQKQAAVAIEDYDTAKLIKAEMDRLRCAAENPQAPPQRPPSALAAAPQSAGAGYEAQEGVAPDIQHGPKAELEMGSSCVGPEDTGAADITNIPGPDAGDKTDVGEGRGEEDEQDGGGGVAAASSPAGPSIPGAGRARRRAPPPQLPRNLPRMWSEQTIAMKTRESTSTVVGPTFKPGASSV